MELKSNTVKVLIAIVLFCVLGGIIGVRYFRSGAPRTEAEQSLERFLKAFDAMDEKTCKKLFPHQARYQELMENRKTLGARLGERKVHSSGDLRFGDRLGLRVVYLAKYENAPAIREEITLLSARDGYEVSLFQFRNVPLPLVTGAIRRYSGGDGSEIRSQVFDFYADLAEWNKNELDAVTYRRFGYVSAGTVKRWEAFHKKHGSPVSLLIRDLYSMTLPGQNSIELCRVSIQARCKIKNQELQGTQYVDLARDAKDKNPRWQVYFFDPGKMTPLKSPPQKKQQKK